MAIKSVSQHKPNILKVTCAEGTVMWVPGDLGNRHRREVEAWLKAGGRIEEDPDSSRPPARRRLQKE